MRVLGGQAHEKKNTSPTKILLLIVHKAVIYKSRVFVNSAQCSACMFSINLIMFVLILELQAILHKIDAKFFQLIKNTMPDCSLDCLCFVHLLFKTAAKTNLQTISVQFYVVFWVN